MKIDFQMQHTGRKKALTHVLFLWSCPLFLAKYFSPVIEVLESGTPGLNHHNPVY